MDELEKRKRLEAINETMGTEGWKHLVEMYELLREQLNDITLYKTEADLKVAQGRLIEIQSFLLYPQQVRSQL